MELLKYVHFCAQKSIIKAGNNKFHDLINVSRKVINLNIPECHYNFLNQNSPLADKIKKLN